MGRPPLVRDDAIELAEHHRNAALDALEAVPSFTMATPTIAVGIALVHALLAVEARLMTLEAPPGEAPDSPPDRPWRTNVRG